MPESKTITPIKKVLLSIDKALNDEIILGNGQKLYLAAEYNIGYNATVTGKVRGLPVNLPKDQYKTISKLQEGDEVAFNYRVVVHRQYAPTTNRFVSIVNERHRKEYINGKRERIMMRALPYEGKLIWIGSYISHKGEPLDGIQDTEASVERWLSKFDIEGACSFTYKNLIDLDDEIVWQSDVSFLYAKKDGESVIALGDRVIMEPIEIDMTQRVNILNGIQLPDSSVLAEYNDKAKVVSGGESYGVKKGDVVLFDPLYLEKYTFWGKNYFLIRDKRINAIL